MAKKPSGKAHGEEPTFESALAELESIVADLEGGKLGLSDALARYELGVKHLKSCHQWLKQAERKIEILSGIDAQGNPITEPFDHEEHDSLEEKAAARGRRRTSNAADSAAKGRSRRDIDEGRQLF